MYEYKCLTCRGTGYRYGWYRRDNKIFYKAITCNVCDGSGYVDWIKNIRQKDRGFFVEDVFLSDTGKIALPIIRHMYPRLIAEDLVDVQPMQSLLYTKGEK